jgi:hypothetical protein
LILDVEKSFRSSSSSSDPIPNHFLGTPIGITTIKNNTSTVPREEREKERERKRERKRERERDRERERKKESTNQQDTRYPGVRLAVTEQNISGHRFQYKLRKAKEEIKKGV